MKKAMTILYEVGNSLYVNLTNRCPCACTFCIRTHGDCVYTEKEPLWLEHEPSFDEVKAAFAKQDMKKYKELVFCGYGEPTEALDMLLQTAAFVKQNYQIPIRINTNGLSDLINGKQTASLFKGLIDVVSISLNTSDPENYMKIVRPQFKEKAWPAMIEFARTVKDYVPRVVMSTVGTTISSDDEKKCAAICKDIGVTYRIREYSA